ncbi:MAG: hypothetical protein QHJ73_08980, partial [Armatimonadota bacterium]|nr:hypothetical protein [Armatimonadota bacterium]
MRHSFFLPVVALWWCGVVFGAVGPEVLIAGFEEDADAALVLSEQVVERTLSTEQASQGRRSLKIVLPPGQYPGVQVRVPADWRAHEALRFDLWCQRPARLGIRIDDVESTGYNTRYNEEGGALRAGWNHVQVPLDRVGRAVNLGKIRLLVLFLQNVTEPITLYLDHIRLGPLVEGYDDRPLPGELGPKKEFAYSREVVTPHVAWAQPLAGGPIRALLVTGVATGREVIELAQRFHLDYDVVTIEKSWDINRWGMGDYYGARGDQGDFRLIYRYLEQALTADKRYDVMVLPMVHGWNMLTPRTRDAVLSRVREGTGLVLVHPFVGREGKDRRIWEVSPLVEGPDDFFGGGGYVATPPGALKGGSWERTGAHFITDGLPLSLLPFERLNYYTYRPAGEVILNAPEGPIAAVREVGKGRVVAFAYRNADFTAHVSGDGKEEPPYPYHEILYRLVGRALQWAARREPPTTLTAAASENTVAWDAPPPTFRITLRGAPAGGATVLASLGPVLAWDRRRPVEAVLKVPAGANGLEWRLPAGTRLDAGTHEARFILRAANGVLDHASVLFTVTPPAEIRRLDAPGGPV